MRLDPTTLALQALNFLILVLVLRRFLYRPVQRIVAERKEQVDAALAAAEADKQGAAKLEAEARGKLDALEGERDAMMKRASADAAVERERLLAEARAAADAERSSARASMAEERDALVAELASRVTSLAVDLSAKILAMAGARELDAHFLDRVLARLDALSPEALRALSVEIAAGKRPRLVSYAPLAEPDVRRARERIASRLGAAKIELALEVDPNLLGGVELHFSSLVVAQSLRDLLEDARKNLEAPVADAR